MPYLKTLVKLLILTLLFTAPALASLSRDNLTLEKLDKAQQAFKTRDYAKAKRLFEKQLKQDDENVVTHLFLAKIAIKNEQLDLAEKHIVKASELLEGNLENPQSTFENGVQAEVFHWLGFIMEMQAEKASIFSMAGYANKSLNAYLKSIEISPKNLLYREALINFYLDAPSLLGGSIDEAIRQAKITFDQDANFGYKMLANCYAKDGDSQLVLATYKRAIEIYPSDAELLLMRGIYYKGEGEYAKAVTDYQRAIALPAIDNSQKLTRLMSWYWIGRISGFNDKHLKRGIEAYQQVLNFNEDLGDVFIPSSEWTQFRMAKLMVLNEQKKEAIDIFTQLLNSTQRENLKDEIRDILD